jgi:hypothetical protein
MLSPLHAKRNIAEHKIKIKIVALINNLEALFFIIIIKFCLKFKNFMIIIHKKTQALKTGFSPHN